MLKKFYDLSRLVQILLLAIPFFNFVLELIIRFSSMIKKPSLSNLIGLVLALIGNVFFAYVDLVFLLMSKGLILVEDD